jgi:hypothetical protein
MKYFTILLIALLPFSASAQTYPSPTFNSVTLQTPLASSSGGTGVANSGTVTLGGNFATSGGYPLTLSLTGSTSLTLPTSGTLVTSASLSGIYAPIASPTFTGTVTIPSGASIAGYAPLASPTFSGTVTVPSGASLGTPGVLVLTNATGLPLTSGVSGLGTGVATALGTAVTGSGAPVLAVSPALTGTPTAPTAASGTNTTQVATTAFVQTAASAPGTPVSVGTSLYPTIVGPINTTATSTNGSNSITVTSPTGIAVGMGVYATFVASPCSSTLVGYFNTYVTAISGSTVTLSCNAIATNSSPVAVQFGQQRYSTTSSILANDVGTQILKVGPASQGNSAAWLDQISTGEDYRGVAAAQILGEPGGGYALVLGSRASDSTGGAEPFPLTSFWYADTWAANVGGENAYFQDVLSSATAGSTNHIQFEQSVNSLWPTVGENPYNINVLNSTVNHRLDCGTGQTGAQPNDCGVAEDIVPNPVAFQVGINFANNAINTSGGTVVGNAIEMPLMDGIVWFASSSAFSTSIYSPTASVLDFDTNSGGSYNWLINSTNVATLTATELQPSTTSTVALGDSSHAFTALYTGTIAATGAITPSTTAGIVGTTTANNANAGSDGEYQSNSASGTSLTSGTAANCDSLTLTAGDWDVGGTVQFIPAGTTVITGETSSASTVSATAGPNSQTQTIFIAHAAGQGDILSTGYARVNVSTSTTVYAVGEATFTTSTLTCNGYLHARRIR